MSFDFAPAELPAGVVARVLTARDAAALAALREEVVSRQLFDPNCYRLEAESPDFPPSHLGTDGAGEKGLIIGLFDASGAPCGGGPQPRENRLIGYGALTLPRPGEANHADALGLSAETVAYLASAMVLAERRGLGLHHALIRLRLSPATAAGRRHAVSAAWPGNHQSWGHLAAHDLIGCKLVQVAGGLPRLLTHCDLATPFPVPDPATARPVPVAELAAQGALFDDGYRLWRRVLSAAGVFAELARPLPVAEGGEPCRHWD